MSCEEEKEEEEEMPANNFLAPRCSIYFALSERIEIGARRRKRA